MHQAENTEGGSINVLQTSCLTGLDQSTLQIKTKIVSCHADDSKPVKQEVNGTMILPPLVFSVHQGTNQLQTSVIFSKFINYKVQRSVHQLCIYLVSVTSLIQKTNFFISPQLRVPARAGVEPLNSGSVSQVCYQLRYCCFPVYKTDLRMIKC